MFKAVYLIKVKGSMAIDVIIEKGIPIPSIKGNDPNYPFADMEVGDSFLCPIENVKNCSSAANRYGARHPPYRFTMRKNRIWRTK